MSPQPDARPRGLPWIAVPGLVYLTVTLAIPLANGAARGPAFAEHAVTTLLIASVIGLAFVVRRFGVGRGLRSRNRLRLKSRGKRGGAPYSFQ